MSLSAWLLTIPQWLSVLLVLGLFVSCGIGLVLLVRRLAPGFVLRPQNDTAGFVFGALGSIYGILLAFVVINVWVQNNTASEIVEQESTDALALYRNLNAYPNRAEADKVLVALRGFTLSVVNEEFPAMRAVKWDSKTQASVSTQKAVDLLWNEIRRIAPRNLQEQSLFNEILMNVNSLAQLRVKRLLQARTGLNGSLWCMVVLGGLITVGFTALFEYESVRVHIAHTIILSLMTGGVIYVIVSLNFPFVGDTGIRPEDYAYLMKVAGWQG